MLRLPSPVTAAPVAIAFSCGIVLAHSVDANALKFPVLLLLLSIIAVALCRKISPNKNTLLSVLLLASCFLAGYARFGLWQYKMFSTLWNVEEAIDCDSLLVEIVSVRHGKRVGAVAEIQQMWFADSSFHIKQRIQLYFPTNVPAIIPARRFLLRSLSLKVPRRVRNPGSFDYRYWLKMRGIAFIADVKRDSYSFVADHHLSMRFTLVRFREHLAERISRLFEAREASLLKALWLGQGKQLDADIRSDFQRTGLVHVLAVSGLHVGFLMAMIMGLASLLRLRKRAKALFCCMGLLCFLCITGFQPAVTRAVIMGVVWIVCRGLERNTHPQQVLFLAAVLILICWPQQLFWLGFQLSFSAVFWIILLYGRFQGWGESLMEKRTSLRWLAYFIPGLAVSLAAQIGTSPLIAYHFGELAPLSLLLNIVVLPVIAFLVGAGPPILALADVEFFSTFFATVIHMLLQVKLEMIHQVAEWDLAIKFRLTSELQIVLAWMLFAGLFIPLPFRVRGYRPTLVLLIVVLLLHISLPFTGYARLLMLDVGQGDCFLLQLRSGKSILVDAGPANRYFDSGRRIIVPTLSGIGVQHLNKLFISHPHRDHVGGLAALLSGKKVDSLYSVPLSADTDFFNEIKDNKPLAYRSLKRGDWMELDFETRLYVLGPSRKLLTSNSLTSPVNNRSLILLIRHRDVSILFTGDAEIEGEQALLCWKNILESQVLKAGHHGSKTSSHPDFLAAVSPEIVLISCGRWNRFRHPSPETLSGIHKRNALALRTDLSGAVWLELRIEGIREKKWR